MHADAAYWSLLTGDGAPPGPAVLALVDAVRAAGRSSVRDLFDCSEEALAALLEEHAAPPAGTGAAPLRDPTTAVTGGMAASLLAALQAIQALRPALPAAARRMERLAADGIDLVTRWDRGYPAALAHLLGDAAPPVLWFSGPLTLLRENPVALLGSRSAGAAALACARALAAGLARVGVPALTGAAGSVGGAVLASALGEPGGKVVALVGQGIARALPDLRPMHARVKEGRLLLVSPAHPDATWQPGMEAIRNALAVALATHLVLVSVDESGGAWDLAQTALHADRPLTILGDDEPARRLLDAGALPLRWPETPVDSLLAALSGQDHGNSAPAGTPAGDLAAPAVAPATAPPLPAGADPAHLKRNRAARLPPAGESAPAVIDGGAAPAVSQDTSDRGATLAGVSDMPLLFDLADAPGACAPLPAPSRSRASRRSRQGTTQADRGGKQPVPDGTTLGEALLAYLRAHARSTVGSGALLQAFDVDEPTLDSTLRQLVAEGYIVQRTRRRGIGYRIAASGSRLPAVFQLSLFSQEE